MTSEWNPQFTIHTEEIVHHLFGIISWYVFASEQISHNCFKFFPHFLYFIVTSECFPQNSLYLMGSIRASSLVWALFCGKHSPSFPKYKWTLSAFRFHYKKTLYIHIPISWDILTSEWYPQYLYRIFLNYAAFSGASEWISQKICYFFLSKLNKLMCSWLFCVFCSLSFLKVQVNAFRKLVLLDTHRDLRV